MTPRRLPRPNVGCRACAVCLLVQALAAGQAPTPARSSDLLSRLESIRAAQEVPALGGAVVVGQQLVEAAVTGVRAAGSRVPVEITDRFHLGSCTKAMTALLLALLVEKGTLSWDLTIGEMLPDLPRHDAWDKVTLYQLITHRAGAPARLDEGGLWQRLWDHGGTPVEQRRDLALAVLSVPPLHPPGTDYLYSNAGYAMAGHIAERAAGKPWEQLMREEIFQPLGMETAGFGAPGVAGSPPDQPRGHARPGRAIEPGPGSDNPAAIGPAGSVHAALHDWGRFVALQLLGHASHPHREVRLVSTATWEKLQQPFPGPGRSYAAGWLVETRPWARGAIAGGIGPGTVLTHAGSNTMWFAVVWIAPERNMALLAVCNQGDDAGASACDQAIGALLQWATEVGHAAAPGP